MPAPLDSMARIARARAASVPARPSRASDALRRIVDTATAPLGAGGAPGRGGLAYRAPGGLNAYGPSMGPDISMT